MNESLEQYQSVVASLDQLVDEVGEDETHPYSSLMALLGVLIEHYEAEYVPELMVEE
jgi:HTH-type transcriptional regulator / antitoxin HigA